VCWIYSNNLSGFRVLLNMGCNRICILSPAFLRSQPMIALDVPILLSYHSSTQVSPFWKRIPSALLNLLLLQRSCPSSRRRMGARTWQRQRWRCLPLWSPHGQPSPLQATPTMEGRSGCNTTTQLRRLSFSILLSHRGSTIWPPSATFGQPSNASPICRPLPASRWIIQRAQHQLLQVRALAYYAELRGGEQLSYEVRSFLWSPKRHSTSPAQ